MSDAPGGVPAPTAAPAANQENAAKEGSGPPPIPGSAQTGDVKSAAAEAMRKYKVKVEGEELEVDEKELLRGYSHQKAASKALNKGIAMRKQAEQVLQMLNSEDGLEEVLKKMGKEPRKVYEARLARQLEDELMDPRDKELRDTKRRLQEIEDMEKRQQEAIKKQHHEQMKARFMKEYEQDFVQALEKSQLPPTKPMVAEMAKYIARSAKIGFKMTPLEAAQLVREDIQAAHQRLIGDADGDMLIKLLGEQVANKIRKHDTAKLKSPEAMLKTPVEQAQEHRERGQPKKRMSAKEWRLHKMGLK